MKKYLFSVVVFLMVVLLLYVTTLQANTPKELKQFIKNTNDEYYWTVNATPNSINIMIHYKDYYKFFSVGLFEKVNNVDKNLKQNLYEINVNDSRIENSVLSWTRYGNKNDPLIGPKRYDTVPYTAYNTKDYYNPITNKLILSMKRITNYKEMEESFIEDWINYSANYNLEGAQGGLPIELEAYQGKLILSVNENKNKMNEVYISSGEWVFIRHVEKGRYPGNVNDDDLDNILENLWRNWKKYIVPLKDKAEDLEYIN